MKHTRVAQLVEQSPDAAEGREVGCSNRPPRTNSMNARSSIRAERRQAEEDSRHSSVGTEHSAANGKMGGSSPHARTKFRLVWAEELPCATGVYNRRWYLETPWFSIRLHHWLHSDDARNPHDHTWNFVTFVLKGSYTDVSPEGNERMTMGKFRYRSALHRHTVQVDKPGCWTLVLTGPKIRNWGFWVGKKWKKSNKYFFEHGKHVCD